MKKYLKSMVIALLVAPVAFGLAACDKVGASSPKGGNEGSAITWTSIDASTLTEAGRSVYFTSDDSKNAAYSTVSFDVDYTMEDGDFFAITIATNDYVKNGGEGDNDREATPSHNQDYFIYVGKVDGQLYAAFGTGYDDSMTAAQIKTTAGAVEISTLGTIVYTFGAEYKTLNIKVGNTTVVDYVMLDQRNGSEGVDYTDGVGLRYFWLRGTAADAEISISNLKVSGTVTPSPDALAKKVNA